MRFIPPPLQQHKNSDATTLTTLLRFQSKTGKVVGFTTLDQDITYDDGRGPVVYRAPIGFQPASIYEALGFEVGNTETQHLLVPEYDLDISEFEVNAGVWDYAEFDMYEVNYEDLSQGHSILKHGTVGQVRSKDGLQMFGELRGLTAQLRKPIVEVDSRTCRAIFGSQPGDPGVRFPCGYDASTLWQDGEVEAVGVEAFYTFTDSTALAVSTTDGYFVPGLVQWLTGKNAGLTMEIDSYDGSTGTFTLRHPLPYAIEVGDTYRRRRDCSKYFGDSSKGCAHWFGAERGLHFRGEPFIPVADIGSLSTPGAGTGSLFSSVIEEPGAGGEE